MKNLEIILFQITTNKDSFIRGFQSFNSFYSGDEISKLRKTYGFMYAKEIMEKSLYSICNDFIIDNHKDKLELFVKYFKQYAFEIKSSLKDHFSIGNQISNLNIKQKKYKYAYTLELHQFNEKLVKILKKFNLILLKIEDITSTFKISFVDANHENDLKTDINEAIQNAFENACAIKNFIYTYKLANEFILALKHSECFHDDQIKQFIKFKNDRIRDIAKIDPQKIERVKEMIRRNYSTGDIVYFEKIDESEVNQIKTDMEREKTL